MSPGESFVFYMGLAIVFGMCSLFGSTILTVITGIAKQDKSILDQETNPLGADIFQILLILGGTIIIIFAFPEPLGVIWGLPLIVLGCIADVETEDE